MKFPSKTLGLMALALCLLFVGAVTATADDPDFGYAQTTTVQNIDPPAIEPKDTADIGASFEDKRRFEAIERRLAAVEQKAISASEAEEIARRVANEVVDKRIAELRVAISTPNGGQRVQTVKFNTYGDSAGIKLNPGEVLTSYTDVNGNIVKVNQPSAASACPCGCGMDGCNCSRTTTTAQPVQWAAQDVSFTMAAQPVARSRTVTVQPVQTVRTGLFGRRTVTRSNAGYAASSGGTCRMVNVGGRMVRVCN